MSITSIVATITSDEMALLVIICLLVAFVVSLALPQALRREWFGSDKRRYAHSDWYQKQQIAKTILDSEPETKRQQYVSLKNIDTNLLAAATSKDYDELSPLECIENGHGYQSIFRSKSNTKKPPRNSQSHLRQNLLIDVDDDSPRESVATSGATSFASSFLFSPSSEMFSESGNKNGGLPARTPLSQRRDLHSNLQVNRSNTKISTPRSNLSTKMDYTPSPLSMVSGGCGGGSFVILTSKDRNGGAEKSDQAIDILAFKALKYIVIDALDPSQSKNREQLIQISGIRGHYPQIFFVNNQRMATYVGNHQALVILDDQGKLTESWLGEYAQQDVCENPLPAYIDSSFFSV